jgi:hypothetical protein
VIIAPSQGYRWLSGEEPDWDNFPPLPERFRRVRAANDNPPPAWLLESNEGRGVSVDPEDVHAPATDAELEAALDVLDPDMGYQDWVRVGAAMKDRPFEIFDGWSARAQSTLVRPPAAKSLRASDL